MGETTSVEDEKATSLDSLVRLLTPRQVEVLALIARGYSNASIARELVIEPKTVERHINDILGILQIGEDSNYFSRTKASVDYWETFPEDKVRYQDELFHDLVIDGITPREYEVLSLRAKGYSNKRVADELGIEPKTVENRMNNIYSKLPEYEGIDKRVLLMLVIDKVPVPEDYNPNTAQVIPIEGR